MPCLSRGTSSPLPLVGGGVYPCRVFGLEYIACSGRKAGAERRRRQRRQTEISQGGAGMESRPNDFYRALADVLRGLKMTLDVLERDLRAERGFEPPGPGS